MSTIRLSGDWQHEPLAYVVGTYGSEDDYRIFPDPLSASDFAAEQEEKSANDECPLTYQIYPLYAGSPIS